RLSEISYTIEAGEGQPRYARRVMMRGKGLVVLVIAGLVVVGFAFYTVLAPGTPRPEVSRGEGAARSAARDRAHEPASEEGVEADEDARARRPRTVAARPAAPVDAEHEPGAVERPMPGSAVGGPPPRPVPEISLEE